MATLGAARAINLTEDVGTLEVGKKADIIILSTRRPHWHPMEGVLPGNLLHASISSDVRTVLVDGQIIMHNWQILTFDEKDVIRRIEDRIAVLRHEVGLPSSYS
jgi:5-methylthioadenosine/S-adenosylhomocysteine deaminase